jgi:hypothetical protein
MVFGLTSLSALLTAPSSVLPLSHPPEMMLKRSALKSQLVDFEVSNTSKECIQIWILDAVHEMRGVVR